MEIDVPFRGGCVPSSVHELVSDLDTGTEVVFGDEVVDVFEDLRRGGIVRRPVCLVQERD